MKTEKIENAVMIVRQVAEAGLAGRGLEYDALQFLDIAHAACAEHTALKKENAELKNRAEVADNRLGDFLDEYNQSPYYGTKRLAQAILNVLRGYYQGEGRDGKAYEGTIKELNQYLAEENTRTVAELESLAVAILGLKDPPGPVPPSMYHRS